MNLPQSNLIPRLSIVIPTYNRPDLLRLCLQSVVRHASNGTEIIVVDDGSRDACASSVVQEFPHVRSLRGHRPRGFCAAANAGIRIARADVVQLLNDDTEATSDWAEPALAWFDDTSVASVSPLVLRKTLKVALPPEIDSAGDRYYLGGVAVKRGHREPLSTEHLQPARVFGASASSAFYRRDVLMRLGSFPESFGAYFEDVDLAFRINRAGYRVIYEPRSQVWHRGQSSYGVYRRHILQQQSRNEERVFWRNIPRRAWPQALPRHLAVLVGKSMRRLREGQLLPFLFGRLQVFGEIRQLMCHNRFLDQLGPPGDPAEWNVEPHYWGQQNTLTRSVREEPELVGASS
jgi:GT2 family glycosyltransferase